MKKSKNEKTQKNSEKNDKKLKKCAKNKQNKKNSHAFLCCLSVGAVAVVCLLVCQFFLTSSYVADAKFYENTKINGLDVSNMSVAEAENLVLNDMLSSRNEIEINLTSGEKSWTLKGSDFEFTNELKPQIKKLATYGRSGNFFQNMQTAKKIKENGQEFQISYKSVLANLEEKVEEIIDSIERPQVEPTLVFTPNEEQVFSVDAGQSGITVLRDKLYGEIDEKLLSGKVANVELPIVEVFPKFDEEEMLGAVTVRGEFSTDLTKSGADRKENIKIALDKFNGLIVESGESVSFNEIAGERTAENGYKTAKIIVGGSFVDGMGGGVCQASTTLYNALLLADIQIDQVYHHSLPVSYVPLSFDAMVSGDYSDLIFTNNLSTPIYIKTNVGDLATVTIYGEDLGDTTIERRCELVKILPHNGDIIVTDEKGEYEDKVLYKGEYYRLKWPKEGYESKGYLDYYENGELVREEEVRHDFYEPQDGILVEGANELGDGMSLPNEQVSVCKPQVVTKEHEENMKRKYETM